LRNKRLGSLRREWHIRKHVPPPRDLPWNTLPEHSPHARKVGASRRRSIVETGELGGGHHVARLLPPSRFSARGPGWPARPRRAKRVIVGSLHLSARPIDQSHDYPNSSDPNLNLNRALNPLHNRNLHLNPNLLCRLSWPRPSRPKSPTFPRHFCLGSITRRNPVPPRSQPDADLGPAALAGALLWWRFFWRFSRVLRRAPLTVLNPGPRAGRHALDGQGNGEVTLGSSTNRTDSCSLRLAVPSRTTSSQTIHDEQRTTDHGQLTRRRRAGGRRQQVTAQSTHLTYIMRHIPIFANSPRRFFARFDRNILSECDLNSFPQIFFRKRLRVQI
jgi:hypothetical protein